MENFSGIFTALCAAVLPIALAVVLCVRKKGIWKPILFGALTFCFFQVLTRIPLLGLVLAKQAWFIALSAAQPILYALFLGATAALFEEGGRFIVMSLFLKKQRSPLDGIAFGVGHGGIEALLFAGINAIFMLATQTFTSTPNLIIAGGVERLSAITMQIGFSVMVIKSVREKKPLWLLLAFVIHTVSDFGAVLASGTLNVWVIEAAIAAVAVLMALFVVREYKRFPCIPKEN